MRVREYGTSGPWSIVLHGGPGAAGYMAPVAEALSADFRVLEPFQRGSSEVPLTVNRHVLDLDALIADRCGGQPPALVGSSWGAMLALVYAAEHPESAGPLVLIGCGTFDTRARARLHEHLASRVDAGLRHRIDALAATTPDPDERLLATGDLLLPAYSYDPIAGRLEDVVSCDARAYRETWKDMLCAQDAGTYPAAFTAISSPVLMLHGADDPHPGTMIRDSLVPHIPHLEYREWPRCGHYPWLEREAREEFFRAMTTWLRDHLCGDTEGRSIERPVISDR